MQDVSTRRSLSTAEYKVRVIGELDDDEIRMQWARVKRAVLPTHVALFISDTC